MGDIEDFTLLLDHGFSCPELGLQGTSWSMLGFYKECPDPGCKRLYIPCDKTRKGCRWTADTNLLKRITDNYDAVGHGAIHSTEHGDIVKVSTLLKIAGIDLDKDNFGGKTQRTEGEVVIIEIMYANYQ